MLFLHLLFWGMFVYFFFNFYLSDPRSLPTICLSSWSLRRKHIALDNSFRDTTGKQLSHQRTHKIWGKKYQAMLLLFCAGLIVFNSLWPSDAIWWHRSGSALAQVMACCLAAPSHYLNQCWLIINEFFGIYLRDSPESSFQRSTHDINLLRWAWKLHF